MLEHLGCITFSWDYQCENTIKLEIGKGIDARHDGDAPFV